MQGLVECLHGYICESLEIAMSKIDDIVKENLLEDGTILLLRDKYIGIRGCIEISTKEVLKRETAYCSRKPDFG